jgi:UDP-N-acetylglucosamine 2-epimerase (non-hydrolysing)
VDDPAVLGGILDALQQITKKMPVVFPIHPRTRKRVEEFGLSLNALQTVEPLGYLEFLNLMSNAGIVLTDSGGLQEETTILRVPCLTLRHNTERPVTIDYGTNIMVGPDKNRILGAVERIMSGDWQPSGPPEYWDGHAAERIVSVFSNFCRRP